MATQQELLNQACEIRDAELEGENTALRVGTMLVDIIEYMAQFMTSAQLDTALQQVSAGIEAWLEGYAQIDSNSGLLDINHSWFVPLATMGTAFDESSEEYTPAIGEIFYKNQSGYQIFIKTSSSGGTGYPAKVGVVYFNKRTGKSYKWSGSEMVELGTDSVSPHIIDYYSAPAFADIAVGQSFFYTPQGGVSRLAVKTGSNSTYSFDPDPDSIYCFKDTGKTMIWNASSHTWQQVGGSDITVINSLVTGGVNDALSAQMGKILRQNIEVVQGNVIRLYNKLANLAFLNSADKAAAAPTLLDWNVPKVTLSVNNYVTPAAGVIITAPQTVEIGASATIIVVPASGYTLGENAITADIGTVSYDSIADNYTITIANVREALTVNINGTATRGVNVTLINSDGYISLVPLSAQTGKQYTGQLTLSQNAPGTHSLPSQVSWSMGSTTGTSQVDSNGQFTIANVTDDITVTANAAVVNTVSYDLHDTVSSNNAATAAGSYYTELTYSNDSNYTGNFYNFAVKVMMGGTEITNDCYSFDTTDPTTPKGIINIPNVIGSIEIEVYAVVIINDKGLDSSDRMNSYEIGDSDAVSISDWNGAVIESYLPFIAGHSYDWRHCWKASRAIDGCASNDWYRRSLNVYDGNKAKLDSWSIQGRDITGTGQKAISQATGDFVRFSLRDIDHCYLYDNTSNRFVWKGNVVESNGEEYTYNGPLKKTT